MKTNYHHPAPNTQTKIAEEVATYLPDYEVRKLEQKLLPLNLDPVHSAMQHVETDPRKTSQDVLAQGKENTGRKEKGSACMPINASSWKWGPTQPGMQGVKSREGQREQRAGSE